MRNLFQIVQFFLKYRSGAFEKDKEFITAYAISKVTENMFHMAGDLLYHQISGSMTRFIVKFFKEINVEHSDIQWMVKEMRRISYKTFPVFQSGQVVSPAGYLPLFDGFLCRILIELKGSDNQSECPEKIGNLKIRIINIQ